jgi:hypothetical protein
MRYYWRPADGVARAWVLPSYGRFEFAGGAAESIAYAFGITDETQASRSDDHPHRNSRSTGGSPVVDVRVRATVEASAPGAVEISWRPGDGRRAVLRLASSGSEKASWLSTGRRESLLSAVLAPGRAVDVELEYVDGDARAWVDGDEVAVLPDPLPIEEAVLAQEGHRSDGQELRISAEGGALVVTDVRVDHDLYYHSGHDDPQYAIGDDGSIRVPADSYFMLGDNTTSSHDSRKWTANGVRLQPGRADGLTEVWWDAQNGPKFEPTRRGESAGPTRKVVTDLDGIVRTWEPSAEDGEILSRRVPFVTRDLVVGRAFFALVFWPLEEVPRRFRLIH